MSNLFLKHLLVLCISTSLLSCNDSAEATPEESPDADSSVAGTTAANAAFAPFKLMLIQHKVADYTKWRSAYEAHDSVRKAYGLTDEAVSRSNEDPNNILISEKISDLQKAKDFTQLPDLREEMTKAGVTSKPAFSYFDVIRRDESIIDSKDMVMVTHRVKDFDAWVKVYDSEGVATRAGEGMVDRMLARAIDDPNFVLITFAITDMEKAKTSITSDTKKKLMISGGVEGVPAIEFYKKD